MTDKVQWKTLPTKANREMEQAGAEAAREYLERNGHNNLWVIYEAMTAAAPQPPTMSIDNVVIVPRELTSEMREAFHEANERYEDGVGESPDSQWRAMLRAAPKPSDHQQATTMAERDERADFESVYAEEYSRVRECMFTAEDVASMRDAAGGYGNRAYLNGQWSGRQARAALGRKP